MNKWIIIWILSFCVPLEAHPGISSAHVAGIIPAMAPPKIGAVDFPITCAPRVRADFNRGVTLLHSFWHDQAFGAFEKVASSDPECAMAYWGEAMTHFHQLLASPSLEDMQAATLEIRQADKAGEKSPRELAYIQALHRFFDQYRSRDYLQRATAYAAATEAIAKAYPHDLEAQVFYALALLASDSPKDVQLTNPRKSLAILQPLFRKYPNHPGIAHYIIHACDNPKMAQAGLVAARHYAQIAPAVPHALHMPAHVFARLGLWEDVIQSNLASKAAAEAAGLHHGAENRLHAMEFLEYAYLQTGRFEEASSILAEARTIQPGDVDPRYPTMWGSVQPRYAALLAIETKDWTRAEHLHTDPDGSVAGRQTILLAQAEGAAQLRDRAAAVATQEQLRLLESKDRAAGGSVTATETRAWVNFTLGRVDDAVAQLEPVAKQQAEMGKGEVEVSAREMVADMLLLSGHPAEALKSYQQSLSIDPNRFNGLLGAGQAAEQLGRTDLAKTYYRTLLANSRHADGTASKVLERVKAVAFGHS